MQQDLGSILAYALYFIVLFAIGLYHMKDTGDMQSYMLGGRKIGPWVSAMSAEASDMSGWMLMGLPGYAYVAGVSAFWIAVGLALGTWLNWRFVAQRLRIYTKIANDSITLPDFFENRFNDTSKILRIVSAVFIFIFFLIYTASGFVAGGRLFTTVFDISYVSYYSGHCNFLHLYRRLPCGLPYRLFPGHADVFCNYRSACYRYHGCRRACRNNQFPACIKPQLF